MPGAVDASESKEALASDTLLSSDWDLTEPGWVSALAARFSSSREVRSLRGFAQLKLNQDAITEPSFGRPKRRAPTGDPTPFLGVFGLLLASVNEKQIALQAPCVITKGGAH